MTPCIVRILNLLKYLGEEVVRGLPSPIEEKRFPVDELVDDWFGGTGGRCRVCREEIEFTVLFRRNPDTGDIDPADPEDPAFACLDCPPVFSTSAPTVAGRQAGIPEEAGGVQRRAAGDRVRRGLSTTVALLNPAVIAVAGSGIAVPVPDGAVSTETITEQAQWDDSRSIPSG